MNGKREGGILSLDAPRADRLRAVTDGIKTPEGVRDLVIRHKDGSLSVRYKVNKATEARILRAYRKGEALSPADQAISVRQYSNALLKDRADTIARAETAQSVMGARREAWDQVLNAKNLPPEAVLKRWPTSIWARSRTLRETNRDHPLAGSARRGCGRHGPQLSEAGQGDPGPLVAA